MHKRWCHVGWGLLLVLLVLAVGCDRGPEEEIDDSQPLQDEPSTQRVISLAPALTKMLVDMGEGKRIAGVGENDDYAPEGTAIVGNYTNINIEAVIRIKPTHVFMMTGKEGAPESLTKLATAQKFDLVTWPYPTTVTEVGEILFNEHEAEPNLDKPVRLGLGTIFDNALAASSIKYKMLFKLGSIDNATKVADRPRVLLAIETGPVGVSGPKTVLDELLRMVNGKNAYEGELSYAKLDREKLLGIKPDVIVLILPKAPPLEGIDKDPRLAELRDLDIPAVKNNRIVLISDPAAQLPSSTLAQTAALLAKAVHPQLADRIDAAMVAKPVASQPQSDEPSTTQPREPRPASDADFAPAR